MLRFTADEQFKRLTMLNKIEDLLKECGELSKRDIADRLGMQSSGVGHYFKKHPARFVCVRTEMRNYQPTKIFALSDRYIQETPFEKRAEKFETQGLTRFAPGFKSLTERFN